MEVKKGSLIVTFLVLASAFYTTLTTVPLTAKANTLYVGGTGSGNYITVQSAIDDANPGDTVYVYSGRYYEDITIDKPLSLIGEDKTTTLVDAGWAMNAISVVVDWVNVTGFTLTGSWDRGGIGIDGAGIQLYQVKNCSVTNNTAILNDVGILLFHSDENTITNNTVLSSRFYGILINNSNNNTVANNTASSNQDGIIMWGSDDNIVVNNMISSNGRQGIAIQWQSSNNTFTGNMMVENGIGMWGDSLETFATQSIDTSNTINGKPVYYWRNVVGGTVPLGAGQVILANCTNVVVENQNVSNGSIGILLGFSTNNFIANNTASSNSWMGFRVSYSNDNTFTNNTVLDNLYGFEVSHSDNNILTNNTISKGRYGIHFYGSNGNYVANSTISSSVVDGISVILSTDTVLTNNDMLETGIYISGNSIGEWTSHDIDASNTVNGKPVYHWKNANGGVIPLDAGQVILANCVNVIVENQNVSNGSQGILLGYSSNNRIANNTALSNNRGGIELDDQSDDNVVDNNTVSDSGEVGIEIFNSDNIVVSNNSVSSNGFYGLYIIDSEGTKVFNNTCSSNGRYGIVADSLLDGMVLNNTVSLNDRDGITIVYSLRNTIANNTIYFNNGDGILLDGSGWNSIHNNTISSNGRHGIVMEGSSVNSLTGNSMTKDGIFISSSGVGRWNTHTITTSNTVNGKPVYYWKNVTSGTIPLGAGQVILANSTNVVVEDQNVSDGSVGVLLGFSSDNTIRNNIASGNLEGISLWDSDRNKVRNNFASLNSMYGIVLSSSSNNSVTDNTMEEDGIYIYGDSMHHWNTHTIDTSNTVNHKPVYYRKNGTSGTIPLGAGQVILANCTGAIIENQDVSNGSVGIELGFSSGNTIARNTVSNGTYGVYLYSSSDNSIYHNNFIDNTNQVFDNGVNYWDNGYPLGGNYWSDYSGIDERTGPHQYQLGADGMGDTPYNISKEHGKDLYPLMSPFVPPPPSPPSDPRNLQASAGDDYVNITWSPPSSDGGSVISSYRVYRGIDSGAESFLATTGTSLYYNDTDVTNGQIYYYKVSAVNSMGEGPLSNEANATPESAPTNQVPTCTISAPVPGNTISGIYSITGTATDPDGMVLRVMIKISDGIWLEASGNVSWSYGWDTTTVGNGEHTIYARSFDGTDFSTEASVTVTIDNAPPQEPEDNWMWIVVGAIVIIVVVILLAFYILIRRKKKKKGEEPTDESLEEESQQRI